MILQTERLILRRWEDSDAENLFLYAKDPLVGPSAGWPVHTSVENSLKIIRSVLSEPETYAVCLKEDNLAIGSIGLMVGKQSHLGLPETEGEIGFWLGSPFWGRGIIPEATRAIIRYAFENLHLSTLWCAYFDGNEKSRRCQEKCGFKYHHTDFGIQLPALGTTVDDHVNCLPRHVWEEQVFSELKGFFMRCDVRGAIAFMSGFAMYAGEAASYRSLFEDENYIKYDVPDPVQDVLLVYQKYFRNVFYCGMDSREAERMLANGLRSELNLPSADDDSLCTALEQLFEGNGLHILCGKTQGFYGPYVWRETVRREYEVELPDGVQPFAVNILSGFVMRSWMGYLTFGQFGTGGWAGKDGVINCIASSYDFESEKFKCSLLKHEAQHLTDFARRPELTATQLEYRAKLVELIYTQTPGLLERFISDADTARPDDAHACAAALIRERMGCLAGQPVTLIQKKASELFRLS